MRVHTYVTDNDKPNSDIDTQQARIAEAAP